MSGELSIVMLGLSITSSWGNGHATTYRGLVRELARRGHRVVFLEREQPQYASNRDMPRPPRCVTHLYGSTAELFDTFGAEVAGADLVLLGSFVPQGSIVGDWVLATATGLTAFYDIDTPVTLAALERGGADYLRGDQIGRYDLYLSFTGGPTLGALERLGAPLARALYCSVDTEVHAPEEAPIRWDLGYLGTYSDDRQPALQELLVVPALAWSGGRFAVAGAQYPAFLCWPRNVTRTEHIAPGAHRAFYSAQRFALNVTRRDMVRAGYAPSVRLFEAAACGVPIVSDAWPGLETIFRPGHEILVARSAADVLRVLTHLPEAERRAIGERARGRVLDEHTAAHRAEALERYVIEARASAALRRGYGRAPRAGLVTEEAKA